MRLTTYATNASFATMEVRELRVSSQAVAKVLEIGLSLSTCKRRTSFSVADVVVVFACALNVRSVQGVVIRRNGILRCPLKHSERSCLLGYDRDGLDRRGSRPYHSNTLARKIGWRSRVPVAKKMAVITRKNARLHAAKVDT